MQVDGQIMYTDVSNVLAEYRAKFVTDQLDVERDNFQNKLKDVGIEKMLEIVQVVYDEYREG